MLVLGLETSCDDTSVAILRDRGLNPPEVLQHLSFSQEQILGRWGGVVPEIAARNHNLKLLPLLQEVFAKESSLSLRDIDLIGVTNRPGLLGPLLTGINCAKTLSLLEKTPIVGVNHLHAHLDAIFLHQSHPTPNYPYLGLIVSGGHGLFLLVTGSDDQDFTVLGSTLDDAPGEAFDKGGKLLNLPYPAGKYIDQAAKLGDENRFSFPIGLKTRKNCDLSFSGVKTALKLFLQNHPQISFNPQRPMEEQSRDFLDVCASYQKAIVAALILKTPLALKAAQKKLGTTNSIPTVLGGGVACNSYLRKQLAQTVEHLYIVPPQYCTDNGAMIANRALRTQSKQLPYPQGLLIDAQARVY